MSVFKPLALVAMAAVAAPWCAAMDAPPEPGAGASAPIKWQANGQIEFGRLRRKIDLRGITTGLQNADGLWLAGYRKNRSGEFAPTVVRVAPDLKSEQSWPFKNSVQQFFIFERKLYALDIAGRAFLAVGQQWQDGPWTFKPGSSVVWAGDFLIACRPTSDTKEPLWHGSCYSPQKQWEVALEWRDKAPQVCGQWLVAVVGENPPLALRINVHNGKVVNKVTVKPEVGNWCAIEF